VRVLHLESGRHLYGGARQAAYLVTELNRQDPEHRLVCQPGHPLVAAVGAAAAVPCPCRGDFDLAYYRRLRSLIRSHRPDIVHVHSRRGADTFGGLAAQAEAVPAVLTRRVESREPRFWLRRKCRPYAAVVAISTAVEDELAAAGVPASRRHRVASAVDTSLFRPDPSARARLLERYALPADARIAACAAQLIARKGLSYLLRQTVRLAAAEPRLRLLIFGRGPLRGRLERQARRLGLAGHVRFCGFADDWPALVPGLDLLLHPAEREGLGAVILEAMSAGVAVVAAAAGGIGDVVEDGVNGRLVPAGPDAAWSDVALELIADASARARLGQAARQTVQQRFTIPAMADRYREIYAHVLTGSR